MGVGGGAAAAGWLLATMVGCSPQDRVVAYQIGGDAAAGVVGDGADGAGALGSFSAPVTVDGLLDATDVLQDPSLSSDELEIYFASTKAGTLDIYMSARASITAPWGAASVVQELSTATYDDQEPELTEDNLTLYFASNRPGAESDTHIWVSRRKTRTDPWGAPEQFKLNGTSMTARGPAIDAQQLALVFYSDGAQGDYDLYRITRASTADGWGPPAALSEVNSNVFDWDPGLFRDGRGLIFGSRRGGSSKNQPSDLFETAAASDSGTFAAPHALSELNSKASEGDPWLSNDGRHIVFSSDRGGAGVSRLYEAWR